MIELFAAAFSIGFLGSLHCVGMCGGLVTAMTMTRTETWWPGVIAYQAGRITTYTTLGLIAGLIGSVFARGGILNSAQGVVSIIAGILIIVLALHIAGWLPDPLSRLAKGISSITGLGRLINKATTQSSTVPWYNVGLINGLLPCGLVYAGVGLSLTASSALEGTGTMLIFGLGTVPAMLAVPILMRSITPQMRGKVLKLGALILIMIGALTIARGTTLGQHDHSDPSQDHQNHQHSMFVPPSSILDPDAYCLPNEEQSHTALPGDQHPHQQ
ncbi:sulfite exporter TauE/SafE family protein [Pseudomonadota bacterium]